MNSPLDKSDGHTVHQSYYVDMGNACIKDTPDITMNCINSGQMASCCHQIETPNDEYSHEGSTDSDDEPRREIYVSIESADEQVSEEGGDSDYSTFHWRIGPVRRFSSPYLNKVESYDTVTTRRSNCFNNFQKCKADGLNTIDNDNFYGQVHLTIYESIYRLDGDVETKPVYSTVIQPYKYDCDAKTFNHYALN